MKDILITHNDRVCDSYEHVLSGGYRASQRRRARGRPFVQACGEESSLPPSHHAFVMSSPMMHVATSTYAPEPNEGHPNSTMISTPPDSSFHELHLGDHADNPASASKKDQKDHYRSSTGSTCSLAEFAVYHLSLLALGAPAELLVRISRAALDQIRHARHAAAFALLSDERMCTSPLTADIVVDVTLLSFAKTVADACVAKTYSSLLKTATLFLMTGRESNGSDESKTRYDMCGDELNHANLAWMILRWVIYKATLSGTDMYSQVIHVVNEALQAAHTQATLLRPAGAQNVGSFLKNSSSGLSDTTAWLKLHQLISNRVLVPWISAFSSLMPSATSSLSEEVWLPECRMASMDTALMTAVLLAANRLRS
jgi:hypothetical protein